MEDIKSQFLKVYANLPLGVREEIIMVINSEPMTWKSTKLEVEQETTIGREALEELRKLKILP